MSLAPLFKDHDDFLVANYGFTSKQVIDAITDIENQVLEDIRRQTGFWDVMRELHEVFKEFVANQAPESFSSLEDLMERYHTLPQVVEKTKKLDALEDSANLNPFEIVPTAKAPREILALNSARFGDNPQFLNFDPSPGWPTNDSIIYEQPLIQINGKFYCFCPQLAFRRMGDILEKWIRDKDAEYYQSRYLKSRSAYLEKKALEYLRNLLPGAEVFGKLYYEIEGGGEKKRVETDGLVLFDENLFIIEAKAGSLSTSAKRGGIERMKRDAKELVDHAYEQALRTKKYIMEHPRPVFEYENGSEALAIKDKENYRKIFLVNVTLENLGHLATELNSLKGLDLLHGREWPWSVFINDLRVISEIVEYPSEFLHFLQRRIRANDHPQFESADELDFLMYYFRDGLYFEDGILKGLDKFRPTGYTDDLDRYFDFVAGRVSTGKKPRLEIPKAYEKLIKEIETIGKSRFTKVTTSLLNFDWKVQQEILDIINEMEYSVLAQAKDRDFTMHISKIKLGITFSISAARTAESLRKLERYCHLKMYQTKFEEWILLLINVEGKGKRNIDFQVYEKKWEYDSEMEDRLQRFKSSKLAQFIKTTGKTPERNDPCPCGSGLKFKKCCGR